MKRPFLSIDTSLANTGVCLGYIDMETGQVFPESIHLHETKKSKDKRIRVVSDTIDRCLSTKNWLSRLIEMHNPKIFFGETPTGSQSSNGMKSYGIVCERLAWLSSELIQVTPDEAKVALAGSKTATKRQMITLAHVAYPDLEWKYHGGKLQNKNEHMADAIAIALAGVKTQLFQATLNLYQL